MFHSGTNMMQWPRLVLEGYFCARKPFLPDSNQVFSRLMCSLSMFESFVHILRFTGSQ